MVIKRSVDGLVGDVDSLVLGLDWTGRERTLTSP